MYGEPVELVYAVKQFSGFKSKSVETRWLSQLTVRGNVELYRVHEPEHTSKHDLGDTKENVGKIQYVFFLIVSKKEEC